MRPGREHDTTAVRVHTEILPALAAAAGDLRSLADRGYEGESQTITVAFKKPKHGKLTTMQQRFNKAHNGLRAMVLSAVHIVERYANNPIEADHGRLKARLRPMRGLKRQRSARILAAGHAFAQNLHHGHYDITADVPTHQELRTVFDELALMI